VPAYGHTYVHCTFMHVRMHALCKGFKKLDKGTETENTLTGSVIFYDKFGMK